jgi:CHAT domain-containing protein
MKDPIEARAHHVLSAAGPPAATIGTLRVDMFGATFRPDDASDAMLTIDVAQITGVNLSALPRTAVVGPTAIAIDTPGQRFRFVLADDAPIPRAEIVATAREMVAEQAVQDAERAVETPPLTRGARRPHAIVSVSDVSSGEDRRTLLVHVSAPGAYASKHMVTLAGDVYEHLLAGFDDLTLKPREDWTARVRELGALLLHNTVTSRAVDELDKLSPSVVTLQIDDLLAHLPWGVLHDGARYPLLATAVSQQIMTLDPPPAPKRRPLRKRALILANPTGDLPSTEVEARGLVAWFRRAARSFEVDVWIGAEASRVKVVSALASGQYEIVHYAGHSHFSPDAPERSAWRLHDGRLTALEIQQNVEGNPPALVYSSSCEGGREGDKSAVPYRRRLFGLTSAFLMGGVRNYVGFFWPIPDDGAADLAIGFYAALLVQGKSVAESLRIARLKMATQGGDPRLWGGVTLFGDPSTRLGTRARA